MSGLKFCGVMLSCVVSTSVWADSISFERPGAGFSTQVLSAGQWVWEQSIVDAHFEKRYVDQQAQRQTTLYADTLLRRGLGNAWELQLGWGGPAWTRLKQAGQKDDHSGVGDVSINVKKAIDLQDEKLSMAILATAILDTGDDAFSVQEPIYQLSSSVDYIFQDDINTGITMQYAVQDGNWSVTAIPTLSYTFSPKWSGFSEAIYRKAESEKANYGLGLGAIYRVGERLQFDASVGLDLDGTDDHYYTNFGFAFAF
jgi:hypothetical protein